MNEVISTFHIDVNLLAAQALNFAIVFFVLYYFAVRPLLKILTERSEKVASSLKNAEQIERELATAQERREEILTTARQEAGQLLADMETKAEARRKELLEKAKEEITKIVQKTKDDIEVERKIAIKHIKEEAAGMIAGALEKIMGEKVSPKVDEAFIKETVKEIAVRK